LLGARQRAGKTSCARAGGNAGLRPHSRGEGWRGGAPPPWRASACRKDELRSRRGERWPSAALPRRRLAWGCSPSLARVSVPERLVALAPGGTLAFGRTPAAKAGVGVLPLI